ncbi:hypothetical protein G3T14_20390 [Methylobacterium sp. BTF04]|uniref:hypothetical protein n=1 Tax=Methylobacterium sp. BTF04 TaxID=2708300 RepID=UPI0013D3AA51|nr:hypothetical protein [Methylobacterium sp. BTF04]NEU14464.1 hypothetical protein [Methylobacterium sp. BTF04]
MYSAGDLRPLADSALACVLLYGRIEAPIPRIAVVGVALPQYFALMPAYLATRGAIIWSALRRNGRFHETRALELQHMRE